MAEVCAKLEMPAMELLDANGVYGAPRFHLAMKKLGLKAHIGAEVTLQYPAERDKNTEGCLPLLASSQFGYQNLCRLITRTKLRVAKHAPSWTTEDELREFAPGLICLTGGEDGPLVCALARGGIDEARLTVERLADIFGRENVYVELQRHLTREEEARNQAAVEIARSLKLPLGATNSSQYARAEQREILDVLTCVREHRRLDTAGRLLQRNSERYVKSPAQMERLFADLPEAIAATEELSSRLEFTLADLGYQFPRYPVPEGETMISFLRRRTAEGFENRYGRAESDLRTRARRQIERELALIEKLQLEGYFLIVWDIVRFCREHGILVQGRGSAANSAVCYSLGITAVDPVGMDLLFERFLSEERGEWPDIDLDLPSGNQRERAIQYVYERYGKLGAAMTANVITYRGRLAARRRHELAQRRPLQHPEPLDGRPAHQARWPPGSRQPDERHGAGRRRDPVQPEQPALDQPPPAHLRPGHRRARRGRPDGHRVEAAADDPEARRHRGTRGRAAGAAIQSISLVLSPIFMN
jgi:error-prone DNA polymerase